MRLLQQRAVTSATMLRRVCTGMTAVASTIDHALAHEGLQQEGANRLASSVEAAAEELYKVAEMLRGERDHHA